MDKTEICVACGDERPVVDMVFSSDCYICDKKECLLAAFEMATEGHQITMGRLEAIKNS